MLIAVTTSGVQFVTRGPRLSNAFSSFFHFVAFEANSWLKIRQTWQRPAAGAFPSSSKALTRSHKQSTPCPKFLLPLAQSSPKGKKTCYPLGLPSRQILSLCVNTHWKYPLQKICGQRHKQTNQQTVNDVSQHACRHVGRINPVSSQRHTC